MSVRILLLEDDRRLAGMLVEYLAKAGFAVAAEASGRAALVRLEGGGFDALVLDLMLPDLDGLDVCRQVRADPRLRALPIVMLTARGDTADRIVGLELGADDYLAKPFEPRELVARLRAVLRRGAGAASAEAVDILRFGRLEIDRGAFQARLDGRAVVLTAHQFALLQVLAEQAGRVLGRDRLLDAMRGRGGEGFDRTIDVHVSKLRQAIEDDAKQPRRILTVRGAGYLFARNQD
jgi:DNA-binding response OmpR family regulator